MRQMDQYGTLGWFEREYGRVSEDPWGSAWRPSQWPRCQRTPAKRRSRCLKGLTATHAWVLARARA
jgi:hypothetical protein